MTKKKTSRQKHQKEASFTDTSDEEDAKTVVQNSGRCPHVSKAVNLSQVRKGLKKSGNLSLCSGCASDSSDAQDEDLPEVWLCLQCGYCGCGPSSTNNHSLQHYKIVHSDCHSVVLHTSFAVVWCYDCDKNVEVLTSHVLKQCVEYVMKLKYANDAKPVLNNTEKITSTQNDSAIVNGIAEMPLGGKEAKTLETPKRNEPRKAKSTVKASPSSSPSSSSSPPKCVVKGLRNLGNTCFFNAVMQNLCQTPLLQHELESSADPGYLWEVPYLVVGNDEIIEDGTEKNLKISLQKQFPLVSSLLSFIKQMNTPSSVKNEITNPSSLFGEISKKSPQFRHFEQQDSHELLRHLLDGIRQDEIKRQKKGILKNFNLENAIPDTVNEETKKLIKAYGCYASHTIVENIFGGLLISTVLCEECKGSSQVFEPFMDLSLPLFEEKPVRNKKFDKDSDENDEESIKSKGDPSKLSKYQEKKMRQQAKKEKKRNKRLAGDQPKQNVEDFQHLYKLYDEGENEQDVDEESKDLDTEKERHSDVVEMVKENGPVIEEHNEMNNVENSHEEECPNKDANEQCKSDNDPQEESLYSENLNQNNFPLIEEEKELEELNEDVAQVEEKGALSNSEQVVNQGGKESIVIEEITENGIPDNASVSSTNSSTNPQTLEEKIQAMCMQVRNIRIRKDSDKQENMLNSQSADECESQKLNDASQESFAEDTVSNDSSENWSHSVSCNQTKEWILRSLTTLKLRNHPSPMEFSINSCLCHFTKSELLTGSNKFRCENCTERKRRKDGSKSEPVYTNASKQLLIFSPPAILTLHLKRFQQAGMNLKKVNRFVEFPLILDLAPFCSSACVILPHMASVTDEVLYSLYGIVEHSGRLHSGHYTAYVKFSKKTLDRSFLNRWPLAQCDLEQLLHKFSRINVTTEKKQVKSSDDDYRWYYISDSHFREVSEAQVLKCQAYLLFYQRIK